MNQPPERSHPCLCGHQRRDHVSYAFHCDYRDQCGCESYRPAAELDTGLPAESGLEVVKRIKTDQIARWSHTYGKEA